MVVSEEEQKEAASWCSEPAVDAGIDTTKEP